MHLIVKQTMLKKLYHLAGITACCVENVNNSQSSQQLPKKLNFNPYENGNNTVETRYYNKKIPSSPPKQSWFEGDIYDDKPVYYQERLVNTRMLRTLRIF